MNMTQMPAFKVCYLLGDEATDAQYHWRVHTPVMMLRKYIDATSVMIGEDIPKDADLCILPRFQVEYGFEDEAKEFFDEIKAQGTKLVYDTDDNIFSDDYPMYMLDMYSHAIPQDKLVDMLNFYNTVRHMNKWVMNQCDFVTASTTRLCTILAKLTDKPVYHVPNTMDISRFQAKLDERTLSEKYGKTTIGWAGGARPFSEIKPLLDAWEIIAQERNDVKFVISGWHPPTLEGYEHFIRKTVHQEWLSVTNYAANMQVDIGCVIASDRPVALSKSKIKAWEFAAAGAMVVGSRNLYGDEPILACDSVEDWVTILTHYVDNAQDRVDMAETYLGYVRANHDIKVGWWDWYAAYRSMLKL
jgi:hypothetical protein